MRIGVLVIATGKYHVFIEPLWESVKKYLFAGHDVTMYVFTDAKMVGKTVVNPTKPLWEGGHYRTVIIPQDCYGWPFSTLMRYHCFWRERERFWAETDFLLYLDVDMRIVAPVGDEMICDGITAVTHPGFCKPGHAPFPHEKREESCAHVPSEQRTAYYCGGVQGGHTKSYVNVWADVMVDIDRDLNGGIIAEWHDESHWNRYLVYNKPDKVMGAEYCVPEEFAATWTPQPKILALKKDHKFFQGGK